MARRTISFGERVEAEGWTGCCANADARATSTRTRTTFVRGFNFAFEDSRIVSKQKARLKLLNHTLWRSTEASRIDPTVELKGCCKLKPRPRLQVGGMCERLKQAVLKTAIPERVSGVRIPLPPPLTCA